MSKLPLSQIQLDYEAGVLPLDDICARYNIDKNVLQRLAAQYEWSQRDGEIPYGQYLAVIDLDEVSEGIYEAKDSKTFFSEDDLVKRALISSVQIMNNHKTDLQKMRTQVQEVAEKVMTTLRVMPKLHSYATVNEIGAYAKAQQILVSSFNSSMQSMQTQINLERKVYQLEDKFIEGAEQQDMLSMQNNLLAEMKKSLADYAKEKSAFTIPETQPEKEKVEAK